MFWLVYTSKHDRRARFLWLRGNSNYNLGSVLGFNSVLAFPSFHGDSNYRLKKFCKRYVSDCQ